MRRVHKRMETVSVWLTAASMLLGTMPHFVCRCSDRSARSFSFGSTSEKSACCCGTSCCSRTPPNVKPGKKAGCCQRKAEIPTGHQVLGDAATCSDSDEPGIREQCCQKTLAEREDYLQTRVQMKGNETKQPTVFALFAIPDAGSLLPLTPCSLTDWQSCRIPPPTDLVMTLQRLTI